jgi:hypothetical protein
MAYMNQEKKAKISPVVKNILKKYNLKGSLSVRNHSTLCLNIRQGSIDFISNYNQDINTERGDRAADRYIDVNTYHFESHFTGRARDAIRELHTAMMLGNHDNSDVQTDYFDVGWYVDINIGRWNQPYALVK